MGAQSFANHLYPPVCPVEAVSRKLDGLVVIAVELSDKGKILSTTVLQSPDPELQKAALKSTLATTFRMPFLTEFGRRASGSGRLYFYFHCSSAPFRALLPSDFASPKVSTNGSQSNSETR